MPDEQCLLGSEDARCGTANGYTNLECRGQACRQGWSIYHFEHFGTAAREERLLAEGLVCQHPGCERGQYAKVSGYCRMHHAKFKRTGSSYGVYGPPKKVETVTDDDVADAALAPRDDADLYLST